MKWLEEYRTALWVVSCLIAAAIAWGILYNSVETTRALALETAEKVDVNGNRTTALETNYQHILDSLRGINAKLDRQ